MADTSPYLRIRIRASTSMGLCKRRQHELTKQCKPQKQACTILVWQYNKHAHTTNYSQWTNPGTHGPHQNIRTGVATKLTRTMSKPLLRCLCEMIAIYCVMLQSRLNKQQPVGVGLIGWLHNVGMPSQLAERADTKVWYTTTSAFMRCLTTKIVCKVYTTMFAD